MAEETAPVRSVPDEWSTVTGANRQRFAFADSGEGPLVILYHGFPDTPRGWDRIAAGLAESGFRAVRPWLRGYHPETYVAGRPYDAETIAGDPIALLDALGEESAILVGHDWGAWMAYGAATLHPDRVRAIVPIAITHPAVTPRDLPTIWAARHMIALNMPWAETMARRNDFAYLERLYRRWAPRWSGADRDEALAEAKRTLADERSLKAAVDHYRALKTKPDPRLLEPAHLPCLVVAGTTDLDPDIYRRSAEIHGEGSAALIVEGAGHWPHREQEDLFLERLIGFIRGVDAGEATRR